MRISLWEQAEQVLTHECNLKETLFMRNILHYLGLIIFCISVNLPVEWTRVIQKATGGITL